MIRQQRAGWLLGSVAAALVAFACGEPPPPPPPPQPMPVPDSPEVASDGNASVTVLGPEGQPAKLPGPPTAGTSKGGAAQPATTDESCRDAPACVQSGACTAKDGSCIVASWSDCERMPTCAAGKCSFEGGRCVTQSDCRNAHACVQEGRCRNGPQGGCMADDCRKAPVCKSDGLCGVSNGRCVARNNRDCKLSSACKSDGRCSALNGECLKSCQESKSCSRNGRCAERKGQGKEPSSCIATTDKQCEASEGCIDMGLCTLGLKGDCVAGDDVECLRSRACKQHGRCSAKQERCVPGSDAECAKSAMACKTEGRCRFQDGRCVK